MMAALPQGGGSWIVARYSPVSLFSLKSALATSSSGKTVLVPTPYAIKMALLDAALRTQGLVEGSQIFPTIRDLRIAIRVPKRLVVINSFSRTRRPWERPKQANADVVVAREKDRARGNYPWRSTIAYREYVQFGGSFELAFTSGSDTGSNTPTDIVPLLLCINYLGRRGGFVQLTDLSTVPDELSRGFCSMTDEIADGYGEGWTMQPLDDCGPSLTFDQANIYSDAKITRGNARLIRHVPLPLRLAQSSRGYSLYTRIEPAPELKG